MKRIYLSNRVLNYHNLYTIHWLKIYDGWNVNLAPVYNATKKTTGNVHVAQAKILVRALRMIKKEKKLFISLDSTYIKDVIDGIYRSDDHKVWAILISLVKKLKIQWAYQPN